MKSLERGGQANQWSLLYLGIKKGKTLHIVGTAALPSIEVQRSPVGLSLHKVVSVQLLLSNHAYRRGEFGNEPFEQLMFDWIQSSSAPEQPRDRVSEGAFHDEFSTSNVPIQPRRLIIARAAVGCKR